ncbi:hypothetical protein VB776_06655 [Arcicella sp. DC2W]|uniref:Uncharacterized protein n=1 Tax=Arcicella gelida TaxID=2984195 RepID=A0ABU5S2B8_9BACT|nr:hypothetical protein [Arcicella sp. DC2W]MEA5402587.1 hypothetical protein [Arcicella sp. DC2W]
MNIQELDKELLSLFEKRIALSQMGYDHRDYDDVEEALHDLEDDFNDKYGDFLESILQEIHKEYCPESDVLLPTAYLARSFKETSDGGIEVGADAGVEVELEENPIANARLMLLPSPTRIVLVVGKKKKIVWSADAE